MWMAKNMGSIFSFHQATTDLGIGIPFPLFTYFMTDTWQALISWLHNSQQEQMIVAKGPRQYHLACNPSETYSKQKNKYCLLGDVKMNKGSEISNKFAQVLCLAFYLCVHFIYSSCSIIYFFQKIKLDKTFIIHEGIVFHRIHK